MSPQADDTRAARAGLVSCWSCKGPVAAQALFCQTCGAIQPPGQLDHFRRLGLEPDFDVDVDIVEKRYLGFQRAIHPDRFATKPAKERALAERQAVALNEAYEVLKDPLRRAAYLLSLKGLDAAVSKDETVRDPELLMEAMEAREALMEATSIDQLKKFRGYFVVVAFVVSAIVTPPDVVSQLSLAIPLCLLYEVGIWSAKLFIRATKKAPEEAAATKET